MVVVIFIHAPISSATVSVIAPSTYAACSFRHRPHTWHARPAIQQNKCKACRHGIILYEAEEKNQLSVLPLFVFFL